MSSFDTTIDNIAEIFDGPHATPKKTNCGPYYLSISSLNKGRLDLTQSAFLSEADFVKWTKRVTPKKGDILFSYETRLGEAALMPDGIWACLGRRMGILRPKAGKVISEYLLYAYLSPKFQQTIISNTIRGATVDRISLNELSSFPIRIPSLNEQKKVSKLLIAIDSKIELNNRINAELEQMAKTIYDYWFVQFDFPISAEYAASVGQPQLEGKPYKSSGGKMVWSDELKREVPEGWEVKSIGELGEISGGSTPSREINEYFTKNGIPWITPKDLSLNTGNKFITKGELDVSEQGLKSASLNVMPKGTVLLSSRAPIGYIAISREKVTTNQGFKSFIPTKGYTSEFIFYTLIHMLPTIENNAAGSTFKEVSSSTLKSIKTYFPSNDIVANFTKTVKSIFEKQNLHELENQKLTELRDWLLPMLMNGQLRVGDEVDEEMIGIAAEPLGEYKVWGKWD